MELIEHLGGTADPAAPASASQLVALLRKELARGLDQVPAPRAGYDRPLVVPFAGAERRLAAVVPVPARLRNDAALLGDAPRPFLIVAAVMEALFLAAEQLRPVRAGAPLLVRYGAWEDALVVAVPWPRSAAPSTADAELAALAFDEHVAEVDRLRALGAGLPAGVASVVLTGLDPGTAVGHRHPLDLLEVLVRGGRTPAEAATALCGDDPEAEALLDGALGPVVGGHRPHGD
ncbi:MAG: hypothetical protein Q7T55_14315, partial [Solirubrobacteraceae bacterium]|nr:hypothetical protein [Solirubrobacteraceae bacterium]